MSEQVEKAYAMKYPDGYLAVESLNGTVAAVWRTEWQYIHHIIGCGELPWLDQRDANRRAERSRLLAKARRAGFKVVRVEVREVKR